MIVADDGPVVVLPSNVLPRATDDADDERLLTARTDAKVAAILHDAYPVRFWDHDLGPAVPHLFAAYLTTVAASPGAGTPAPRLARCGTSPPTRASVCGTRTRCCRPTGAPW